MTVDTQPRPQGRFSFAPLILLFCAFIWGTAFAAQKVGMDKMGPLLFVSARFALALLSIVVALALQHTLWRWAKPSVGLALHPYRRAPRILPSAIEWKAGSFLAFFFVTGMATQQMGLVHTTVANSAFITGLYVVLVPIIGIVHRQAVRPIYFYAGLLALAGLYFLCFPSGLKAGEMALNRGDVLTLACAMAWAFHVYYTGVVGHWGGLLRIAGVQFFWACLVAGMASLYFEPMTWLARYEALHHAWFALFYTGVISGGLAYFLQLYAQRHTTQSAAAIILSSEVLFGALAGWWFLEQPLSLRAWIGGALMMAAMLLAQAIPAASQVAKGRSQETV